MSENSNVEPPINHEELLSYLRTLPEQGESYYPGNQFRALDGFTGFPQEKLDRIESGLADGLMTKVDALSELMRYTYPNRDNVEMAPFEGMMKNLDIVRDIEENWGSQFIGGLKSTGRFFDTMSLQFDKAVASTVPDWTTVRDSYKAQGIELTEQEARDKIVMNQVEKAVTTRGGTAKGFEAIPQFQDHTGAWQDTGQIISKDAAKAQEQTRKDMVAAVDNSPTLSGYMLWNQGHDLFDDKFFESAKGAAQFSTRLFTDVFPSLLVMGGTSAIGGAVGSFVPGAGTGVGAWSGAQIGSAITGFGSAFLMEGGSGDMDAYNYFRQQGMGEQEAAKLSQVVGARKGLINGALEFTPFHRINKRLGLGKSTEFRDAIIEGTWKDWSQSVTASIGRKLRKPVELSIDATTESLTEWLQTVSEVANSAMYEGEDGKYGFFEGLFDADSWKHGLIEGGFSAEGAYSALSGAGGGFISAGTMQPLMKGIRNMTANRAFNPFNKPDQFRDTIAGLNKLSPEKARDTLRKSAMISILDEIPNDGQIPVDFMERINQANENIDLYLNKWHKPTMAMGGVEGTAAYDTDTSTTETVETTETDTTIPVDAVEDITPSQAISSILNLGAPDSNVKTAIELADDSTPNAQAISDIVSGEQNNAERILKAVQYFIGDNVGNYDTKDISKLLKQVFPDASQQELDAAEETLGQWVVDNKLSESPYEFLSDFIERKGSVNRIANKGIGDSIEVEYEQSEPDYEAEAEAQDAPVIEEDAPPIEEEAPPLDEEIIQDIDDDSDAPLTDQEYLDSLDETEESETTPDEFKYNEAEGIEEEESKEYYIYNDIDNLNSFITQFGTSVEDAVDKSGVNPDDVWRMRFKERGSDLLRLADLPDTYQMKQDKLKLQDETKRKKKETESDTTVDEAVVEEEAPVEETAQEEIAEEAPTEELVDEEPQTDEQRRQSGEIIPDEAQELEDTPAEDTPEVPIESEGMVPYGHKITLPDGREITLNNQQVDALNKMLDLFMQTGAGNFTLAGYAGTGKTTIALELIRILTEEQLPNIGVSAPTHKAKKVVGRATKQPAMTLQSALGLKPNVDLDEFDPNDPKFAQIGIVKIKNLDIFIIDEASMINKALYNVLLKEAKLHNVSLLFMGDPAQLPPVGENISEVFTDNKENSSELTQVERQQGSNPLMKLYDYIRNNISKRLSFPRKTDLNAKKEGIIYFDSIAKFRESVIRAFKSKNYKDDPTLLKLLAFTNKSVQIYNDIIHKARFGKDANLIEAGEVLQGYKTISRGGEDGELIIENSAEYVVTKVEKGSVDIQSDGEMLTFTGFMVTYQDSYDEKFTKTEFILDHNNPDNVEKYKKKFISLLRQAEANKKLWWKYFEFSEAVLLMADINTGAKNRWNKPIIAYRNIDYGYATTIHKSQGSTYNTVYVLDGEIDSQSEYRGNIKFGNQLKYVAFSRPTNRVIAYHPKAEAGTTSVNEIKEEAKPKDNNEAVDSYDSQKDHQDQTTHDETVRKNDKENTVKDEDTLVSDAVKDKELQAEKEKALEKAKEAAKDILNQTKKIQPGLTIKSIPDFSEEGLSEQEYKKRVDEWIKENDADYQKITKGFEAIYNNLNKAAKIQFNQFAKYIHARLDGTLKYLFEKWAEARQAGSILKSRNLFGIKSDKVNLKPKVQRQAETAIREVVNKFLIANNMINPREGNFGQDIDPDDVNLRDNEVANAFHSFSEFLYANVLKDLSAEERITYSIDNLNLDEILATAKNSLDVGSFAKYLYDNNLIKVDPSNLHLKANRSLSNSIQSFWVRVNPNNSRKANLSEQTTPMSQKFIYSNFEVILNEDGSFKHIERKESFNFIQKDGTVIPQDPSTNGQLPNTEVVNFLEHQDGLGVISYLFGSDIYNTWNIEEIESAAGVQQVFRINPAKGMLDVSNLESMLNNELMTPKMGYMTIVGHKSGSGGGTLVMMNISKDIFNMVNMDINSDGILEGDYSHKDFVKYINNEVSKSRMTQEQAENVILESLTAADDIAYYGAHWIAKHEALKSMKHAYYLAEPVFDSNGNLVEVKPNKGLRDLKKRLRIDFAHGIMFDRSYKTIPLSDDVTLEIDGVEINLFEDFIQIGSETYRYDGVIWASSSTMIDTENRIGRQPENSNKHLHETKSFIRVRENQTNEGQDDFQQYVAIKGMEFEVVPNMVWKDSSGNIIAQTVATKSGGYNIVDANGDFVDFSVMASEEIKQSYGFNDPRSSWGLNEVISHDGDTRRVQTFPKEKSKDSVTYPFAWLDTILALADAHPDIERDVNIINDWLMRNGKMNIDNYYHMLENPIKLAQFLNIKTIKDTLLDTPLPKVVDAILNGEITPDILLHPFFAKPIESKVVGKFVIDRALRGRANNNGTIAYLKPDVDNTLQNPHDMSVGVGNTAIWNFVKKRMGQKARGILTNLQGQNGEITFQAVKFMNSYLAKNLIEVGSNRVPITDSSSVDITRVAKFDFNNKGDNVAFPPVDVFGRQQGDHDGDKTFISFFPEQILNAHKRIINSKAFNEAKLTIKLEGFLKPTEGNRSESIKDTFAIIRDTQMAENSIGELVNTRMIYSLLNYKGAEIDFNVSGESGFTNYILEPKSPDEIVVMDFAPLDINNPSVKDQSILNQGEKIVKKVGDKFVVVRNMDNITTSDEIFLQTNVSNMLSYLIQASVDNEKFGLMEFWGYTDKSWALQKLFKSKNSDFVGVEAVLGLKNVLANLFPYGKIVYARNEYNGKATTTELFNNMATIAKVINGEISYTEFYNEVIDMGNKAILGKRQVSLNGLSTNGKTTSREETMAHAGEKFNSLPSANDSTLTLTEDTTNNAHLLTRIDLLDGGLDLLVQAFPEVLESDNLLEELSRIESAAKDFNDKVFSQEEFWGLFAKRGEKYITTTNVNSEITNQDLIEFVQKWHKDWMALSPAEQYMSTRMFLIEKHRFMNEKSMKISSAQNITIFPPFKIMSFEAFKDYAIRFADNINAASELDVNSRDLESKSINKQLSDNMKDTWCR